MFKISSCFVLIFFVILHLWLPADCRESHQQQADAMATEASVKITTLHGQEIIPYIHKIAELRIAIFREYPYLYEGSMAYEEQYLSMYSNTEDAMIVILEDHHKVVGAVTGLPLAESMEEIKALFVEKDVSSDRVFYLGEIILLKEYRNKNVGYMLYQHFEQAVKEAGRYDKIALCEVVRSEGDLRRPQDYKPLSSFWLRQGYVKHSDLIAYFSWQEIGAVEETKHPMVFWSKDFL